MSRTRASDVIASLDELQAVCPNLERVAIVVAWFGTDLRAGVCDDQARRSRTAMKSTHGAELVGRRPQRAAARTWFRRSTGRPAFGGTPSDAERHRT